MVRFLTWDEGVKWFSGECYELWVELSDSIEGLCESEDETNALRWTAESLFDLGRCLYDHIFFHGYESDNFVEIEDEILKGLKLIVPVILSRLDLIEDPSDNYIEAADIIKQNWLSIIQACRAFPMDKTAEAEGSTLFIFI